MTTSPSQSGTLYDARGLAHAMLGARKGTRVVVRPDGHIASRGDAFDLAAATHYLDRWLRLPSP